MTTIREAAQQLLDARDRFGWSVEVDAYFHKLRDVLASEAQAAPMFWVRLCSDGTYEGPIHNNSIELARKTSGAWSPLHLHPVPPVEQPAIASCIQGLRNVIAEDTKGAAIQAAQPESIESGKCSALLAMHRHWRLTKGSRDLAAAAMKAEQPGAVGLSEREAFDREGMRRLATLITPFAGQAVLECVDEIDRLRAALAATQPAAAKITEEQHVAAVKVLLRANGLDGLPQRMLDAMIAAAPPAATQGAKT